ncbi:MAG: nucleotidyltransferase family protein [Clostridia bacterium]|nr:nucleotidyltransferase family protein [Clostridia bacterium]
MRTIGIIAEYNPFHNGHAYHVKEAMRQTGSRFCIAAMSGSFVQRGEPAFFDKFLRARLALESGISLVLELPTVFVLSSAEQFACGGVKLLSGFIDTLAFGTEAADMAELTAAGCCDGNIKEALHEGLSCGKSYPRAMGDALLKMGMDKSMLSRPNNILAVEYIKAVKRFSPSMDVLAIDRIGSGHDSVSPVDDIASASFIRQLILREGASAASPYLPYDMNGLNVKPWNSQSLLLLLKYRLLMQDGKPLFDMGEVSEGFENVLMREIRSAESYEDFLTSIKTKRFTLARLRRMCMCVLLGIDKELQSSAYAFDKPPYLRVLGVRRDTLELLLRLKNSGIPIITSRADVKKITDETAKKLWALDEYAYMLRNMLCGGACGGDEFARKFLIV